jgi:hypothetical protein
MPEPTTQELCIASKAARTVSPEEVKDVGEDEARSLGVAVIGVRQQLLQLAQGSTLSISVVLSLSCVSLSLQQQRYTQCAQYLGSGWGPGHPVLLSDTIEFQTLLGRRPTDLPC